ncbi:hypothetical protein [Candidatus Desulfovibrio trichonymphae]|uniref:DUF302 domain-containing protein n=1 Tax=Candidatus Desulfovibrio trichonymphae TaxID=1725232 RepID=A0A1J1DRS1_9BACT|nr:hypothetical protein [Candidatus Desulfovibrio trichonymphae]BAV92538.1 conserved hypothetical protein [Candidatus Desulfovibrio trichonymphae]GHU90037.1 hypothetical protein AGMMS49925_01690 [Deltaproteobacteria bacterium]GHU99108.1 hypothetical protein AGMMS50248_06720 [Deltaproteobacteria bacterium]
MKTFFRIILTGCAVLCALTLWVPQTNAAQTASQTPAPQSGKSAPDKPEKNIDRITMISVQPEGTDSIGARLGTRLKERFNSSNLFTLNDNEEKDTPRLLLLLSTSPEFSGRPGVGSIYSVCWVFSQGKGYLGYLLARDMGAVNYEEIEAVVDKLAERTDAIAAKYGNLWK